MTCAKKVTRSPRSLATVGSAAIPVMEVKFNAACW